MNVTSEKVVLLSRSVTPATVATLRRIEEKEREQMAAVLAKLRNEVNARRN